MRTYEISSPAAAERYFTNSFVGDVAAFVGAARARMGRAKPRRALRNGASPTKTRRHGVLDRLDHWFWRQQQKAQERYLAAARDRFDLERRIDAIDRGTVERYY